MPVLASTITTVIVFFPVMFLFGVAKYLFSALSLAVVLSMLASYVVAMTVIPIYCARFLTAEEARAEEEGTGARLPRRVHPRLRTLRRPATSACSSARSTTSSR